MAGTRWPALAQLPPNPVVAVATWQDMLVVAGSALLIEQLAQRLATRLGVGTMTL